MLNKGKEVKRKKLLMMSIKLVLRHNIYRCWQHSIYCSFKSQGREWLHAVVATVAKAIAAVCCGGESQEALVVNAEAANIGRR